MLLKRISYCAASAVVSGHITMSAPEDAAESAKKGLSSEKCSRSDMAIRSSRSDDPSGGALGTAGQPSKIAERARAVKPEFEMSASDAKAVLEICRRVDSLPLAIELAAARINTFSPEAILSRLSKPLASLIGGPGDSPQRQKTMRQTIAWSYKLLSTEEQRSLRRLAEFVGSTPPVTSVMDGKDSADVLGGLSSR
jgi:hypothetical protein